MSRKIATAEELAKQRMSDLTGQKFQEFEKYKEQAPGIQQQQINDARRGFAQSLHQGVNNLNRNANSSGMLFSGRHAAGEAGIRGEAAMGMASEKDAIANRMRSYLDSTNTDITNQRYGIMTNNAQEALASAQAGAQKAIAQQAQISGLMNAGGQMAGGLGGGKPSAGNPPPATYQQSPITANQQAMYTPNRRQTLVASPYTE